MLGKRLESLTGARTIEAGIHGYCGAPRTGKTWLAHHELVDYCARSRCGAVVVDSGRAQNFEHEEHEPSLESTIRRAWSGAIVYRTPDDQDELDAICRAIRVGRGSRVALMIDELAFWSPHGDLERLLRTWRHAETAIFVTAQNVTKDVASSFQSCAPTLRLFRLAAPRSLHWAMEWHGIDPDQLRALPDRHYFLVNL